MHLDELPQEVLFSIASFLPSLDRPYQDLCTVAGVCRRWHDVIDDDRLWKIAFSCAFGLRGHATAGWRTGCPLDRMRYGWVYTPRQRSNGGWRNDVAARFRILRNLRAGAEQIGVDAVIKMLWDIVVENDGEATQHLIGAGVHTFVADILEEDDRQHRLSANCFEACVVILSMLSAWDDPVGRELSARDGLVEVMQKHMDSRTRMTIVTTHAIHLLAVASFRRQEMDDSDSMTDMDPAILEEHLGLIPHRIIPASAVFDYYDLGEPVSMIMPLEDLSAFSGRWLGHYFYYDADSNYFEKFVWMDLQLRFEEVHPPPPSHPPPVPTAADPTGTSTAAAGSGGPHLPNSSQPTPTHFLPSGTSPFAPAQVFSVHRPFMMFSGQGVDADDIFTIKRGRCSDDGVVSFVKQYNDPEETEFVYEGRTCAFGMVGMYHDAEFRYVGGWLLWKAPQETEGEEEETEAVGVEDDEIEEIEEEEDEEEENKKS
ncbi:uncharacterized protein VTP21DRAFT_10153 [Calcarisporiella thermophila]|uniref:uncharacterized protein n=1 Tax=Calcarisporiella thermophila TaxID=911321 RepID=UPI003743F073